MQIIVTYYTYKILTFGKLIGLKLLACSGLIFVSPFGLVQGVESMPVDVKFEYVGKVLQKKGTHIWGASPIQGNDGRIHLYVAEWPIPTDASEKFSGWYKHCQIAHYVGETPEGPFEFVGIAVPDLNGELNAPHNPSVSKHNGQYILTFIVNENNDTSTQRIMMYVADDLKDTWRPAAGAEKDGTILRLPSDPEIWSHHSSRGITNPSLIKHNGEFMLYFKAVLSDPEDPDKYEKWHFGYGVATSTKLEGPYQYYPDRITPYNLQLEDVAAFTLGGSVYMFSRDIRGTLGSSEGGILWRSEDGYQFNKNNTRRSFETLSSYLKEGELSEAIVYRGTKHGQLERPQLLFVDGVPTYMYVATGTNTDSGYGSASHLFKLVFSK